ncbi:hypothetical protein FO519_006023 [Halicephalobus sp. NKZ332]|nr:hypothetical protein FO519_006023 [Halicephalobus sp. NKZ332]
MNSNPATALAAFQQQQQIQIGSPGIGTSNLTASLYPSSPILPSPNSVLNSALGKNLETYDILKMLPTYQIVDWLQLNQTNSSPINLAAINMLLNGSPFNQMNALNQEGCNAPMLSNSSPPEIVTSLQQPNSQLNLKQDDSLPQNLQETTDKDEKNETEEESKGRKQRKSKAKVTAIPGMPVVQRIRRRKRNGSIPEEDESPAPQKVSPPGCKQPAPPSPEEQQMNTPDDPVIHSPPSLRLSQAPGANPFQQQMQGLMQQCPGNGLLMGNPTAMLPATPDSQISNEDSSRPRRTKTCRVCNDHATGYNFNVITCESCKAFFRRNALRPRTDFKCPYSDDCEINAVSRRFCQKCRLKKCFDVGMKKEWILNEEQLKRRKNSRLNSLKGPNSSGPNSVRSPSSHSTSPYSCQESQVNAAVARNNAIVDSIVTPIRNQALSLGTLRTSTDSIMSPSSVTPIGQQLLSPMNCNISPASQHPQLSPRLSADVLNQLKPIPLSEIVMAIQKQTTPNSVAFPPPSSVQVVKVVAYSNRLLNPTTCQILQCGEFIRISLPIGDYSCLLGLCPNKQMNELPNGDIPLPDEGYDPLREIISDHVQKAVQRAAIAQRTNSEIYNSQRTLSDYTPQVRTTSLLPSGAKYDDVTHYKMGPPPQIDALSPESRERHAFIENAIASELNQVNEDVEEIGQSHVNMMDNCPGSSELIQLSHMEKRDDPQKKSIQLNAIELKELDAVRNAFSCMEEPLQDPEAAKNLMKKEHTPSDVLNIMDVTIRRIVRTAKKLSHFQEISNDGKLQLLRSSMIDMLTVRGVSLLDERMESWKTQILGEGQQASISCNMFDQLCNADQKMKFMDFCKTISPTLRSNRVAMMLIALVILFDNSRAKNLHDSDQEIVRRYHELYYHLLQRYVESVYGESAPDMIKTVPLALRRLAKITEGSAVLFMDKVDSKSVAKLPSEFFKLESNSSKSDTQVKREPEESNP